MSPPSHTSFSATEQCLTFMPPAQKAGGRTGEGQKCTGGMTGSKGKFPHRPATPRHTDMKNETTSAKADLIGGERQSEGQ